MNIDNLSIGNKVGHLRPHTGRYEFGTVTDIVNGIVKLVHKHRTRKYLDNHYEMEISQIKEYMNTPSVDFSDGRPLMKIKTK